MNDTLKATRLEQLMRSPGGCALLLEMQAAKIEPEEAVEPLTALHLVALAAGWDLDPWIGSHDRDIESIFRHGRTLRGLAERLIDTRGIEAWSAQLDRSRQIWMQPETQIDFPSAGKFVTPGPPDRHGFYAQRAIDAIVTSSEYGGSTSQLAAVVSGMPDWRMDTYAAERRRLTIAPEARVLEIDSAEDWHAFVTRHGIHCDPAQTYYPNDFRGQPWGANDGLIPDWPAAAREWDGVHVTLRAFLTATQVRIESDAGWSEPWAWGGEETTWLHWAFDSVMEMSPIQASPNDEWFEYDWRREIRPPRSLHSQVFWPPDES